MSQFESARHICRCLELAVLMEASVSKPGNVSKTNAFANTRYEHFLASAVALSSPLELAAERGIMVRQGKIDANKVGIGKIILDCVVSVNYWQHGGNTLLGTSILLSPLAVAAGMTENEEGIFDVKKLRGNLKPVLESTTPEDAVDVYEAIGLAKPGGLGESSYLDVNDPRSAERIRKQKISLYRVFEIASSYDTICSEWVSNYPVTFDLAYPTLMEMLKKSHSLNTAVTQGFLKVLAQHPDTLIARKTSIKKAEEVSSMAREIIQFDLESVGGRKRLMKFDDELRRSSNVLNPGTTADIISAALALCILGGYRP